MHVEYNYELVLVLYRKTSTVDYIDVLSLVQLTYGRIKLERNRSQKEKKISRQRLELAKHDFQGLNLVRMQCSPNKIFYLRH